MASSAELETTNWYRTDVSAFTSHLRHHGVLLFTLLFFSLVFLVAFFFFYFICKFTAGSSSAASAGPREVEAGVRSKGLDAEAIRTLPAVEFVSLAAAGGGGGGGGGEKSECAICLGMFEEVEMVKVMPDCLHVFHADCVDTWLSNRPSCPLCRSSLDSISVEITA